MYSNIAKVFILSLHLRAVYGKTTFCDQKAFNSILTNEIFTKGNGTYSSIDIIVKNQVFRWNLDSDKISEPTIKSDNVLVRIFIPKLPVCRKSGDDCEELRKLSDTAITFSSVGVTKTFSYKIIKYQSTHKEEDCEKSANCDLPWNMSSIGDILPTVYSERDLWPKNWIKQTKPVAAYDPSRNQLIYIINPRKHLESPKILRKSLDSSNWADQWEESELQETYSFTGLSTFMAINSQTKQPLRKNMDRIFAFILQAGDTHKVQEYYNKAFTPSDYNYRSLFHCPKIVESGSNAGIYIVIGVVVAVIVVIIVIVVVILCMCGRTSKKTSRFHFGSSSSGGIGSKSSDSFSDSKRKSQRSKNVSGIRLQ